MSGMKELVEAVSLLQGTSRAKARQMIDDVVSAMTDAIIYDGGICIKGVFSIKPKLSKGRDGVVAGVKYHSEDKKVLSIHAGKVLSDSINRN